MQRVLILVVLVLSLLCQLQRSNAFTMTAIRQQGSQSSSSVCNKQRSFVQRYYSNQSNLEDVSREDSKMMTPAATTTQQLLKTMMIVSIISIGSIFMTNIASVSALNINNLNDDSPSSSFLLAKGAYVPEAGYDSLDFSMPSYRVDADVEPIKSGGDISMGGGSTTNDNEGRTTSSKKAATPNRAEKGAIAVAEAKAKKEAAKAESLAKQKALKEKAFIKAE